ncbi:MAG: hypothetical protein ACREMY_26260, partial [bacterium]
LWKFGDRKPLKSAMQLISGGIPAMTQAAAEPKDEGHEVTKSEAVVQAQLRLVVAVLKMVRDLLPRMLAALPLSAQELNPQADLDPEPDVTSEVRRVIECVLTDCLDPALTDLSAAAEYRPASAPAAKDSGLQCPE